MSSVLKESLAGQGSLNKFVSYKLKLLEKTDKSLRSLFELMFSESNNIIGEETDGYRIKKTTYGESKKNVAVKTGKIMRLLEGVELNSVVGLYLENSLDWIECFWAILKAGYRPLLMNYRFADELSEQVISDYSVKAVISLDKDFSVLNVHLSDIDAVDNPLEADDKRFADEVLLMSSNTSDNLKVCAYTGERFYYHIQNSYEIFKSSPSIKKHYKGRLKLLTFLPFYHVFGLFAVYMWFCFYSRTLVFLRDMSPKTLLHTIKRHEVTHIFAVPILWDKIYKTAIPTIKERGEKLYNKFLLGMRLSEKLTGPIGRAFRKKAFKEVRDNLFGESPMFLISGGGYISPDVLKFMNGIGYHLVNGYGTTETGITSVELSESLKTRIEGSVGKPFTHIDYTINDGGELVIGGKSRAKTIYSKGEAVEQNDDTPFNSHDLFRLEGGRYYIDGRKDDLIIGANGENLNPGLIEPKLYVDGVETLALVPSKSNNENAILLVEPQKSVSLSGMRALYERILARVTKLNLAASVEKIILTSTPLIMENDFKVNRKRMAKAVECGALKLLDLDPTREALDEADGEMLERVREIFANALGKKTEDVAADANFFFDLSGTSLEYFTVITQVQSEFGISFPAAAQSSASTVEEVVSYIKSKRS
ncbi:MAG: AMP-binding protein [Clostridiales bacterium]|nr:AMP-binding protein [Clostridiales bacterium]